MRIGIALLALTTFVGAQDGSLEFHPGPINQVLVGSDLQQFAVYAVPEGSPHRGPLLLTHARRDIIPEGLTDSSGMEVIAPLAENLLLEEPEKFWEEFSTGRFHDYAQQSTKILGEAIQVKRWVKGGDVVTSNGATLRVIDTPGYTRGAVSYVAEIDGKKTAFTGDLIYGDGKIFDLYSFQDAIPTAQVGGYHGYGGRLADLLASVRKLQEEKLDLIVPVRGPLIREPGKALQTLTTRVQALYRNYLSTNALHWYFKEDRMRICGERILGKGADIELMPYSLHVKTPEWVFETSTSRLLISDDGHGFLLDCGYQRVIDAVQGLITQGLVKKVEGIFVTHFHDDHADMVQTAAELFDCPVYATEEYADVLEHPEAYHLPAMTANPIKNVKAMKSGSTLQWHELEFTFHFYPGQTYYHGAVFVKKPGEKQICFVGDSFAPSGMDDYCVLNRNLAHEDTGYLLCLKKLRDIKEDYWIVNQHIPHVFRFSDKEMDFLESRYRQRIEILRELFPWDDPNYGIDEQWAMFYPYGAKLKPGNPRTVSLRLTNHSPVTRTFKVTPRGSRGLMVDSGSSTLKLAARQSGAVEVKVLAPSEPGHYIVTADVESEGMAFHNWAEALLTVE